MAELSFAPPDLGQELMDALNGPVTDPNYREPESTEFQYEEAAQPTHEQTTQAPEPSPAETQTKLDEALTRPINEDGSWADEPKAQPVDPYVRGVVETQAKYEAQQREYHEQQLEAQAQAGRSRIYHRALQSGLDQESALSLVAEYDQLHANGATVHGRQAYRAGAEQGAMQFAANAAETIFRSAQSALGEKGAKALGELSVYKDTPHLMKEIVRAAREGYMTQAQANAQTKRDLKEFQAYLQGIPGSMSFEHATAGMSNEQALHYALTMPLKDPNEGRPMRY